MISVTKIRDLFRNRFSEYSRIVSVNPAKPPGNFAGISTKFFQNSSRNSSRNPSRIFFKNFSRVSSRSYLLSQQNFYQQFPSKFLLGFFQGIFQELLPLGISSEICTGKSKGFFPRFLSKISRNSFRKLLKISPGIPLNISLEIS